MLRDALEQLAPTRLRNGRHDPDVLEPARVVVQAEQERARQRAVVEPAKSCDDAIGRALALDLDHCAHARLVAEVAVLRHDAVDAVARVEPGDRTSVVGGELRQREGRLGSCEQLFEQAATLDERQVADITRPGAR